MEHNLFTPFGYKPLQYPHHTKWHNGSVHVVTHPDKLINVGDQIFAGFPSVDQNGQSTFAYIERPAIVTGIIETRPARGEHVVDFQPVFQHLSIF